MGQIIRDYIQPVLYLLVAVQCTYVAYRFHRTPDGKARLVLIATFVLLAALMLAIFTHRLCRVRGWDLIDVRLALGVITFFFSVVLGALILAMRQDRK